jgi:subtilase family serine protease
VGTRVHTNIQIRAAISDTPEAYGPPFAGVYYEDPASLSCIYRLVGRETAACNPFDPSLRNPNGGGNALAIVDAYDNPNIVSDLGIFNGQFGIAATNPSSFVVVFAPHGDGAPGSCMGAATRPPSAARTGWDIEASLDVEWAHAMAPMATLYLVEAQSNSFADLLCAVSTASDLVAAAGGGEVSMSWGSGEFAAETTFDSVFTTPGIVYFASSGDSPGVSYPSASPNVVSVGGTSTARNDLGDFIGEHTWQATGGGPSRYEAAPSYQADLDMPSRATPDVSSDANPYTGVWVYNSSYVGQGAWFVVGGTSVSAPTWAGIVNSAGSFAASSSDELTEFYSDPSKDFKDITKGDCGPYMGYSAGKGWDFCSGNGSPRSDRGK